MIVYKFGGASVKNVESVVGLKNIVEACNEDLVVVISAMNKTTNALEELVEKYLKNDANFNEKFDDIIDYHMKIVDGLFPENHPIKDEILEISEKLLNLISKPTPTDYNFAYDQIVSFGEIFSTKIVSEYLKIFFPCEYVDIKTCLRTDNCYGEANVLWEKSENPIKDKFNFSNSKVCVTQGFIASDGENSTTLGREGSDYTASILANILDAEKMVVWKDVPGILNADPKWFDTTEKLSHISYKEAIELAYYGATIIHPKTIKPLQNKNIPLFVNSFLSPQETGTIIDNRSEEDSLIPSFIFRIDQVLISISSRDFSFVVEENLSEIFRTFADANIKINLMENSAISFSVCIDNDLTKVEKLINILKEEYKVLYNENVELITIRYYNQDTINRVLHEKTILIEQRSRFSARFVVKPADLN